MAGGGGVGMAAGVPGTVTSEAMGIVAEVGVGVGVSLTATGFSPMSGTPCVGGVLCGEGVGNSLPR